MIWFDVTDTMRWKPPVFGITRTEIELASGLLDTFGDLLSLCRFQDGAFKAVSHEQYLAKISLLNSPIVITDTAKQGSLYSRAQQAYGVALACSPAMVGKALKVVVKAAKSALPPLKGRIQTPIEDCSFVPGDLFVSVGAGWDDAARTARIQDLSRARVGVILFCYDLIPVLFPHLSTRAAVACFAEYWRQVAPYANTILCISEHTKRDLVEFLSTVGAPRPRIETIFLGSNPPSFRCDADTMGEVVRGEFILYVSTIERRKNHSTLYKAYVSVRERCSARPPLCVCVGARGWGVNEALADIGTDPRIKGDFLLLHHVSDAELQWLYERCLFTVFPSLYEGWGLPVAESLNNGKFVLASSSSSIPEVAGPFAEYLDPWDVEAWARGVLYYSENRAALRMREESIRAGYRSHSWKSAAATLAQEARTLEGSLGDLV